ncbi:MAG TPA: phosphatase PAP2 family protein, partial [Planctomycetota bacterium]|nr:phosphatase PAP2 family protein [Planctomycetota bacterium]
APVAYLALNVAVMGGTIGIARLEARRPSKLTTFLHAWWPVLAVPISFKQIAWVAPGVHPYGDFAWDVRLQALDEKLFGNTREFFRRIALRSVADLVTIGYWSYFFLPVILGASLYRAGDLRKFREATSVLLVGWFISYLGYFLVPAVGPHLIVDGLRAPELDGFVWAGWFHRLLVTIEGTIPDAFPSGHALVAILVAVLAWRLRRPLFWRLLPFAAGLVIATMYLRYHYVVDVLVSVLLVVPCVGLGIALNQVREPGGGEVPRVQIPDPSSRSSELQDRQP